MKSTFYFLYVQLEFLCGQLFTFNKINQFAFYMVNSTSYMVNFYFFYGQVDFLCGQLFTFFIG